MKKIIRCLSISLGVIAALCITASKPANAALVKLSAQHFYSWAQNGDKAKLNKYKRYINIADRYQNTALCLAQQAKDRKAYSLLLDYDASPNVPCHDNNDKACAVIIGEKSKISTAGLLVLGAGALAAGAYFAFDDDSGSDKCNIATYPLDKCPDYGVCPNCKGKWRLDGCENGHVPNANKTACICDIMSGYHPTEEQCKATYNGYECKTQNGCYVKDVASPCAAGFDTKYQSVNDCGTGNHTEGWTYTENGTSGGLKCGKCTEKEPDIFIPDPENPTPEFPSCNTDCPTEKTGVKVEKTLIAYFGDTPCYSCSYSCAENTYADQNTCQANQGWKCDSSFQGGVRCWFETSESMSCPTGYSAEIETANDCETTGSNGYNIEPNGKSGGKDCNKCVAKGCQGAGKVNNSSLCSAAETDENFEFQKIDGEYDGESQCGLCTYTCKYANEDACKEGGYSCDSRSYDHGSRGGVHTCYVRNGSATPCDTGSQVTCDRPKTGFKLNETPTGQLSGGEECKTCTYSCESGYFDTETACSTEAAKSGMTCGNVTQNGKTCWYVSDTAASCPTEYPDTDCNYKGHPTGWTLTQDPSGTLSNGKNCGKCEPKNTDLTLCPTSCESEKTGVNLTQTPTGEYTGDTPCLSCLYTCADNTFTTQASCQADGYVCESSTQGGNTCWYKTATPLNCPTGTKTTCEAPKTGFVAAHIPSGSYSDGQECLTCAYDCASGYFDTETACSVEAAKSGMTCGNVTQNGKTCWYVSDTAASCPTEYPDTDCDFKTHPTGWTLTQDPSGTLSNGKNCGKCTKINTTCPTSCESEKTGINLTQTPTGEYTGDTPCLNCLYTCADNAFTTQDSCQADGYVCESSTQGGNTCWYKTTAKLDCPSGYTTDAQTRNDCSENGHPEGWNFDDSGKLSGGEKCTLCTAKTSCNANTYTDPSECTQYTKIEALFDWASPTNFVGDTGCYTCKYECKAINHAYDTETKCKTNNGVAACMEYTTPVKTCYIPQGDVSCPADHPDYSCSGRTGFDVVDEPLAHNGITCHKCTYTCASGYTPTCPEGKVCTTVTSPNGDECNTSPRCADDYNFRDQTTCEEKGYNCSESAAGSGCWKQVSAKGCTGVYSTAYQSIDDCSKINNTSGWEYIQDTVTPMSGGSKCGYCKPLNEGCITNVSQCADASKPYYNFTWNSNGLYTGDTPCGTCAANCKPEYFTSSALCENGNDGKTYICEKITGSDTPECYNRTDTQCPTGYSSEITQCGNGDHADGWNLTNAPDGSTSGGKLCKKCSKVSCPSGTYTSIHDGGDCSSVSGLASKFHAGTNYNGDDACNYCTYTCNNTNKFTSKANCESKSNGFTCEPETITTDNNPVTCYAATGPALSCNTADGYSTAYQTPIDCGNTGSDGWHIVADPLGAMSAGSPCNKCEKNECDAGTSTTYTVDNCPNPYTNLKVTGVTEANYHGQERCHGCVYGCNSDKGAYESKSSCEFATGKTCESETQNGVECWLALGDVIKCNDGYSTAYQSVANCGQLGIGAEGWKWTQDSAQPTSNDRKCGKCDKLNQSCQIDKSAASCNIPEDPFLVGETTGLGYYQGDDECQTCSIYKCASGYYDNETECSDSRWRCTKLTASSRNITCWERTDEGLQCPTGSDTSCETKTSYKATPTPNGSYSGDQDCVTCSYACDEENGWKTACPEGFKCESTTDIPAGATKCFNTNADSMSCKDGYNVTDQYSCEGGGKVCEESAAGSGCWKQTSTELCPGGYNVDLQESACTNLGSGWELTTAAAATTSGRTCGKCTAKDCPSGEYTACEEPLNKNAIRGWINSADDDYSGNSICMYCLYECKNYTSEETCRQQTGYNCQAVTETHHGTTITCYEPTTTTVSCPTSYPVTNKSDCGTGAHPDGWTLAYPENDIISGGEKCGACMENSCPEGLVTACAVKTGYNLTQGNHSTIFAGDNECLVCVFGCNEEDGYYATEEAAKAGGYQVITHEAVGSYPKCYERGEPTICNSGYSTTNPQSVDQCGDGTSGALGWELGEKDSERPMVNGLECRKPCTKKNAGCDTSCPTETGHKVASQTPTGEYYGDEVCYSCEYACDETQGYYSSEEEASANGLYDIIEAESVNAFCWKRGVAISCPAGFDKGREDCKDMVNGEDAWDYIPNTEIPDITCGKCEPAEAHSDCLTDASECGESEEFYFTLTHSHYYGEKDCGTCTQHCNNDNGYYEERSECETGTGGETYDCTLTHSAHPCYKRPSDACPAGYSTKIQDAEQCETTGSKGYWLLSNGTSNGKTCNKCEPLTCSPHSTPTSFNDCGATKYEDVKFGDRTDLFSGETPCKGCIWGCIYADQTKCDTDRPGYTCSEVSHDHGVFGSNKCWEPTTAKSCPDDLKANVADCGNVLGWELTYAENAPMSGHKKCGTCEMKNKECAINGEQACGNQIPSILEPYVYETGEYQGNSPCLICSPKCKEGTYHDEAECIAASPTGKCDVLTESGANCYTPFYSCPGNTLVEDPMDCDSRISKAEWETLSTPLAEGYRYCYTCSISCKYKYENKADCESQNAGYSCSEKTRNHSVYGSTTCYVKDEPLTCPEGLVTSAADCGTTGAAGYTLTYAENAPMSGDKKCGACTAKSCPANGEIQSVTECTMGGSPTSAGAWSGDEECLYCNYLCNGGASKLYNTAEECDRLSSGSTCIQYKFHDGKICWQGIDNIGNYCPADYPYASCPTPLGFKFESDSTTNNGFTCYQCSNYKCDNDNGWELSCPNGKECKMESTYNGIVCRNVKSSTCPTDYPYTDRATCEENGTKTCEESAENSDCWRDVNSVCTAGYVLNTTESSYNAYSPTPFNFVQDPNNAKCGKCTCKANNTTQELCEKASGYVYECEQIGECWRQTSTPIDYTGTCEKSNGQFEECPANLNPKFVTITSTPITGTDCVSCSIECKASGTPDCYQFSEELGYDTTRISCSEKDPLTGCFIPKLKDGYTEKCNNANGNYDDKTTCENNTSYPCAQYGTGGCWAAAQVTPEVPEEIETCENGDGYKTEELCKKYATETCVQNAVTGCWVDGGKRCPTEDGYFSEKQDCESYFEKSCVPDETTGCFVENPETTTCEEGLKTEKECQAGGGTCKLNVTTGCYEKELEPKEECDPNNGEFDTPEGCPYYGNPMVTVTTTRITKGTNESTTCYTCSYECKATTPSICYDYADNQLHLDTNTITCQKDSTTQCYIAKSKNTSQNECSSGYTKDLLDCKEKENPTGWTYRAEALSDGSICGKCEIKDCPDGTLTWCPFPNSSDPVKPIHGNEGYSGAALCLRCGYVCDESKGAYSDRNRCDRLTGTTCISKLSSINNTDVLCYIAGHKECQSLAECEATKTTGTCFPVNTNASKDCYYEYKSKETDDKRCVLSSAACQSASEDGKTHICVEVETGKYCPSETSITCDSTRGMFYSGTAANNACGKGFSWDERSWCYRCEGCPDNTNYYESSTACQAGCNGSCALDKASGCHKCTVTEEATCYASLEQYSNIIDCENAKKGYSCKKENLCYTPDTLKICPEGTFTNREDCNAAGYTFCFSNSTTTCYTGTNTIPLTPTSSGNEDIVGMESTEDIVNGTAIGDEEMSTMSTTAANNNGITIIHNSTGNAYGMRGLADNMVLNEATGTITIHNNSTGNAYGMYTSLGGTAINRGTITIDGTTGTSYGIYGEGQNYIVNSGTIDVSGKDAYGIYIKDGKGSTALNTIDGIININASGEAHGIYVDENSQDAVVKNEGTITINGVEKKGDLGITLNGATFETSGNVVVDGDADLSTMGGRVVLAKGGSFEAMSVSGDVDAGTSTVMGGNQNTYTTESAFKTEDVEGLNVQSESALFDAKVEKNADGNGYNITQQRKNFAEFTPNASIANYLETNYEDGNLETMFDDVKSETTQKGSATNFAKKLGYDVMPNFADENFTVMKSLTRNIADNILKPTDDVNRVVAGYDNFSWETDTKGTLSGSDLSSNTMYTFGDKRLDNKNRLGLGLSYTQLSTSYDMGGSRDLNIVSIFVPYIHKFTDKLRLASVASIGYGYGDYDRGSYESDINDIFYGLTNELRYTADIYGFAELEPALMLNAIGYSEDGFDEGNGDDALETRKTHNLSVEAGIGLYFKKDIRTEKYGKLGFKIGGAYYHEFGAPYDDITARMKKGNGTWYKMNDYAGVYNRDRAIIEAMVDYEYKRLSLYLKYNRLIQKNNPQLFDLGVKYNF